MAVKALSYIGVNSKKFEDWSIYSQKYLGMQKIDCGKDILSFRMDDQKQRLENNSINCEVVDISEVKNINEKVIALYPTVGENLDYLNSSKLKIDFLYRKLDQYSWQYCNKGFFNFKNYIPKIITTLN